jgi:hypothetical protein
MVLPIIGALVARLVAGEAVSAVVTRAVAGAELGTAERAALERLLRSGGGDGGGGGGGGGGTVAIPIPKLQVEIKGGDHIADRLHGMSHKLDHLEHDLLSAVRDWETEIVHRKRPGAHRSRGAGAGAIG